jgi:ankyrin repeat protein
MHYVATHDLVEVGRILLERHVDLDAKTGDGRTALDLAREKGSKRAVRMLSGDD